MSIPVPNVKASLDATYCPRVNTEIRSALSNALKRMHSLPRKPSGYGCGEKYKEENKIVKEKATYHSSGGTFVEVTECNKFECLFGRIFHINRPHF